MLFFFQGSLSHKDIYRLGYQMALGVQELHVHWYIHCDIALRNFLVSKHGTKVVIADFGLCCSHVSATEVFIFFIGRVNQNQNSFFFMCVCGVQIDL